MALFIKSNKYLKPIVINFNYYTSCLRVCSISMNSRLLKKNTDLDDDVNKPIEYLKSNAALWKAQVSRSGKLPTGPWYQPYVISISLGVFMLYFFYLREESDVDLEFNKSLYDRISGLEEKNLEISLEYNKEKNLPTADIEKRLREIQKNVVNK